MFKNFTFFTFLMSLSLLGSCNEKKVTFDQLSSNLKQLENDTVISLQSPNDINETEKKECDSLHTALNIASFDKFHLSYFDAFEVDALNAINAQEMLNKFKNSLKINLSDEGIEKWLEGLKSFEQLMLDLGTIVKKNGEKDRHLDKEELKALYLNALGRLFGINI